jgi:serine/threonine-protein kinase
VAEAVQAAHQRGIVHRDLKPGNLVLTADGTPKLTDFGLAPRLEGTAGLTQTGVPVGTPSYMAPEQAEGRSSDIGPAADTYALGAILYELLTGRPPFRAQTAAETLRQVISEDPVPPSRLNAAVPRDAETICLKCLEKDPQRRYLSAAALAEDLQRFQRNELIVARPVGPLERLLRWTRRNPTAAALVATALALVGLAVGGGFWMERERAERRAETARQEERALRAQAERQAELRNEVGTAVDQALNLRKGFHFQEAQKLLEQARQRLEPAGPDDLRGRIDRAQADLKLVKNLDAARQCAATFVEGRFGPAGAEALYKETLAKAGLGHLGDDSEAVAARIRDSAVPNEIVAALDDWASITEDPARMTWLLAVARAADPDPSRDRLFLVLTAGTALSMFLAMRAAREGANARARASLIERLSGERSELVSLQAKIDPLIASADAHQRARLLGLRGHLNARRGHWDQAAEDFGSCLQQAGREGLPPPPSAYPGTRAGLPGDRWSGHEGQGREPLGAALD